MKHLLFVLAFALAGTGFSEDLKWWTEEYPPYNYKDSGKTEGIAIELLEAVHKELGINKNRANYKVAPWARGYKAAQKKGKLNVIFSTTRTEQREGMFKWFGPITATEIALFGKKGAKKLSDDAAVKGHSGKFAGIRGDIGLLEVKNRGVSDKSLMKAAKFKQIVSMVQKGKADYFAYERNVANFLLKKEGFNPDDFEVVYVLKKGELWYAVNKTVTDATVTKFQNALDKVKGSDAVKKVLMDKFKVTPVTKANSLFPSNKW